MNILAISCSPRKNGNTVTILEEVLRGAGNKNADVELYTVSGKNLQPCDGCWACASSGKCHINDDMQELYEKIVMADGLVFGTPIYFWGMTGQAKVILDRTISLNQPERNLTNKVAGVVAVCGSLGLVDALKDLSYFFIQRRMLPANQVSAYLTNPDQFNDMEQCQKAARQLGEQIVTLVEMGFKYPEEYIQRHGAFGTHTR
ncbi:MAG: flavodoxin family protein [Dehalococcoidales bacterium]|nr:MAG: flavodoxin family protein [Dehalococcoidales bacterium]